MPNKSETSTLSTNSEEMQPPTDSSITPAAFVHSYMQRHQIDPVFLDAVVKLVLSQFKPEIRDRVYGPCILRITADLLHAAEVSKAAKPSLPGKDTKAAAESTIDETSQPG